jgi:hypothetical protein
VIAGDGDPHRGSGGGVGHDAELDVALVHVECVSDAARRDQGDACDARSRVPVPVVIVQLPLRGGLGVVSEMLGRDRAFVPSTRIGRAAVDLLAIDFRCVTDRLSVPSQPSLNPAKSPKKPGSSTPPVTSTSPVASRVALAFMRITGFARAAVFLHAGDASLRLRMIG